MKTQNANTLEDKKDRFTPGEWKIDYFDDNCLLIYSDTPGIIAYVEQDQEPENHLPIKANAEHIVKCVNAFPMLLDALELAFSELCDRDLPDSNELIDKIDAVLIKVKS